MSIFKIRLKDDPNTERKEYEMTLDPSNPNPQPRPTEPIAQTMDEPIAAKRVADEQEPPFSWAQGAVQKIQERAQQAQPQEVAIPDTSYADAPPITVPVEPQSQPAPQVSVPSPDDYVRLFLDSRINNIELEIKNAERTITAMEGSIEILEPQLEFLKTLRASV